MVHIYIFSHLWFSRNNLYDFGVLDKYQKLHLFGQKKPIALFVEITLLPLLTVLKIDFNHTDYHEMLKHFASEFKVKVKNHTLFLPDEIGEGYMKIISLPNGLQGMLSDYTLHRDVILNRTKNTLDYFTLRFDEVLIPETKENIESATPPTGVSAIRSAVYLGSTKYDWIFYSTKGTKVKGVNILFSKEWLQHFVEVETVGDIIKKYLSLKMSAFNYEPMDVEY